MRFRNLTTCAALLLLAATTARASGPSIDWDPAYTWEGGATAISSVADSEFKMVGTISAFDVPFEILNANDPTKQYTFYVHGLISLGTVTTVYDATHTTYQTNYTGGSIEVYEDVGPVSVATFDPNPPNATVPANFINGNLILSGNFTSFVVQANNFTAFDVGNIEGNITWTGGSLLPRTETIGGIPCPGLFTGGSTWYPPVLIPGYIYRHDGKIDLQCPTAAKHSTWGNIKALYR
jgi:hypothetical protein